MPLPNFPQMLLFRKGYLAIEAVLEKVIFSLFSQFRLVLFSSCPKSGKAPINGELRRLKTCLADRPQLADWSRFMTSLIVSWHAVVSKT
jgi:hypothetical protein